MNKLSRRRLLIDLTLAGGILSVVALVFSEPSSAAPKQTPTPQTYQVPSKVLDMQSQEQLRRSHTGGIMCKPELNRPGNKVRPNQLKTFISPAPKKK